MKLAFWRNGNGDVPARQEWDNPDHPDRIEARAELTKAQERINAIRAERLMPGPYNLEGFSPQGQATKCQHVFVQKMILGGPPEYWCMDCEWQFNLPQSFAIPKQHIVPYALLKFQWALKYFGPDVVKDQLMRPHLQLNKPGHPEASPLAMLADQREELGKLMELLDEELEKLPLPEERASLEEPKKN